MTKTYSVYEQGANGVRSQYPLVSRSSLTWCRGFIAGLFKHAPLKTVYIIELEGGGYREKWSKAWECKVQVEGEDNED